jgi:hypothetical protein
MGRTRKELDRLGRMNEERLAGMGKAGEMLCKNHSIRRFVWFILHNSLKTLGKQAWILLTVCYPML